MHENFWCFLADNCFIFKDVLRTLGDKRTYWPHVKINATAAKLFLEMIQLCYVCNLIISVNLSKLRLETCQVLTVKIEYQTGSSAP